MSENMVQELERLRKLLDTTSPEQLKKSLARDGSGSDTAFSGALTAAESTVERLNDAMESGEEEVNAAFRRTNDLHKTNAARKDAELQGLRKVVAAKEKSIDSLRAQLATSKASLEAYTQEAEAIMQQKDNEVQRVREDLMQMSSEKREHESTIIEQQDHIEKLQDSCRELQEAAQALKQDGDQKYAASLAQIKQDRKQQEQLRHDIAVLKKQLATQVDSLEHESKARAHLKEQHERQIRQFKLEVKRKLEHDMKEHKHALKAERRARKAAESWLRSELRSREKIESLPVSVRDVILARPDIDISDLTVLLSSCSMQEEIESLFVSVRDVILARPDTDISDLTALLSSPRRRRMRELQLDDLTDLLQDLATESSSLRRSYRAETALEQERAEQDNLLLKAKVQHAKQLLRRSAEEGLTSARGSHSSSPDKHIRSAYRSDSRQEAKHSSSMQAENQRLKDELQRVHNEIAQQMQGLQKD